MKTIPDFVNPDGLKIRGQHIPDLEDGVILYLTGYLDTYGTRCFDEQMTKVMDAGFSRIIFECSQLAYMTEVGSFILVLKQVRTVDGHMVMANVQPKVYEVFRLLGCADFIPIEETLADAIYAISHAISHKDADGLFPKVFNCPICSKRLKAEKAGRCRCPDCHAILIVDSCAAVLLG